MSRVIDAALLARKVINPYLCQPQSGGQKFILWQVLQT
jgi:hypothetical protein